MQTNVAPPIYCPNPSCSHPRNSLGRKHCENCQTPLIYRYLWAVGPDVEQVAQWAFIDDRYYVTAPQVWLDTKPGNPIEIPENLPDSILPYLHLYPHRLHIPEVFGFGPSKLLTAILLDNVPLDAEGNLYPALADIWPSASPINQVYWLWQITQLWTSFTARGVGASLLDPYNLRVDNWRIRLLQLLPTNEQPSLADLANVWQALISKANPKIQADLQKIQQLLSQTKPKLSEITTELNQILLQQTAQLPLQLEIAGATDTGTVRDHNEDSCYPTPTDLKNKDIYPNSELLPKLLIVCDGVGGHDGGEVASQLALKNLKSLSQNLLLEIEQQTEIDTPDLIGRQIGEIIRVVNNLIANENNNQGRELKQRMGTTLVMGLQVPQRVKTSDGMEWDNSHELYIANVGDSRAYWLTANSCLQLTLDDDVAVREVKLGRSLYHQALQRTDANTLTQALGTRDADSLNASMNKLTPKIDRFLIVEDGILMLCSDGLSDKHLVEKSWMRYAPAILEGKMSLDAAIQDWINLGNQENGHDNISLCLLLCRVNPPKLALLDPTPLLNQPQPLESELSDKSKALLYTESEPPAPAEKQRKSSGLLPILALLGMLLIGLGVVWYSTHPEVKPSPSPSPTPNNSQPSKGPLKMPKPTK